MSTLVLAQHDNATLDKATLHAVTAATRLGGDIHVLVAGKDAGAVASAAAKITGVSQVLHVDHESLAAPLAENLAALLAAVGKDYEAIVAAATTLGKNVIPRLAAVFDVAPLSDVVEIVDATTFKRYIYAGNALATVKSSDAKRIFTIRGTAFEPAAAEGGNAAVTTVAAVEPSTLARFVGREVHKSARPELTSARVIVSGGRGVASADNFKLIEELADTLGAAVGASRAAVDAGYRPNDYQVGQTGKIVAPELYIAIGISGAIQHLAGMKDSKIIVAINKDEEAPIFQVADFGLVADLFTVVPELTRALKS